jgi:GNAT superfamily N-acetyltransferase
MPERAPDQRIDIDALIAAYPNGARIMAARQSKPASEPLALDMTGMEENIRHVVDAWDAEQEGGQHCGFVDEAGTVECSICESDPFFHVRLIVFPHDPDPIQRRLKGKIIADLDGTRDKDRYHVTHREIDPGLRRRRIGTMLLDALERHAKNRSKQEKKPLTIAFGTGQLDVIAWLVNAGFEADAFDRPTLERILNPDADLEIAGTDLYVRTRDGMNVRVTLEKTIDGARNIEDLRDDTATGMRAAIGDAA